MKAFYVMAACVVLAWVSTACCGMLYADRSEEYYAVKAELAAKTAELESLKSHDTLVMRLEAAEAVIRQVEEDEPDYVGDVLSEGDTYQNWLELTE